MAAQDPAQVARGLVTAFNDGDWDTVRDSLTSDSVYDEVGTSRRLEGVDTIIGALHGWKEAMPDVKGTVASSLTAGNTAVLEVSWTGTQTGPMATPSGTIPASGKRVGATATLLPILALALVLVGGCGGGGRTRSILVPTTAMEPTIKAGQTVTADLDAYKSSPPDRGDVIIFEPTAVALASCGGSGSPDALFVKRVIGLPGERVTVQQGHRDVLINGTPFDVPDAAANPAQGVTRSLAKRTFKVPPGKIFVLGDNRSNSCDSQSWPDPFVPETNVIGKVRL